MAMQELQELLKFGRTPVLQAVRRLADDTLVIVNPRHGVAVAHRRCGGSDELDEFLVVDLARGQKLTRLPNDGARTGAFTTEPAVQHRSAGQHNGRDVDGSRRHQLCRRGLVAAGGKHDAVDEVTVKSLHQPEVAEVAVQCGGRTLAGFLNRVHRKFERNAAGLANPFTCSMGKLEVVAVT